MKPLRTISVLPTMFTLGNLVCGFYAIVVASQIDKPGSPPSKFESPDLEHIVQAAILIFAAMLFDALDGRVHEQGKLSEELLFTDYADLGLDGSYKQGEARLIKPSVTGEAPSSGNVCGEYDIETVRYKDHVRLTIKSKTGTVDYIVALPDSTRYCYISFTGAYYHLNVVSITRSDEEIGSDYIPRIAELLSYIDGEAGDVPNVQVDDYRSDATDGVLITDTMEIDFHAKSLPTARLIWHCPFVCVFSSTNGKVTDEDYREFALVRLDGEVWETGNFAKNEVIVSKNDDFDGWDKWKELNKAGFDCHVSIKRNGNVVTVITENGGIFVKTNTTIKTDDAKYYVALTGDQCALTKIYFKVSG